MSECGCGSCEATGDTVPAISEPATEPGPIPLLDTRLTWRDVVGGWGVRWGIGRTRYRVAPGLYRIGTPHARSPVLVTANYKLTVDTLRSSLPGHDAWVLVLDTRGINVWCAAGKGTFGTEELVRRVRSTGLAHLVGHRRLIVPQLGATGVAAHDVKAASGFSVVYGPVRARDIPEFLANRMRATPEMRRVRFDWRDRLVLAPVELVAAARPALGILLALLLLDLVRYGHPTTGTVNGFVPYLGAILAGGVLVPLLLPWLPFRSFALNGAAFGFLWAAGWLALFPAGSIDGAGTALLIVAIISFMTLGFTGASTFTTLAGVRLEVRYAFPALLVLAAGGVALKVVATIGHAV